MGAREIYEEELKRLAAEAGEFAHPHGRFDYLDFLALKAHEGMGNDWLVEDVWPRGRSTHLHAARKVGKSLVSLWIAGNLALGREPFTGLPCEPVMVGLHDFEMTEDDVLERLEDMGFDLMQLQHHLHYYLNQPVPALDTEKGGSMLLENCIANNEQVVIIDTLSRVVEGNENDASTYTDFYRHTGSPLKAAGISLMRLDHEGHQEGRSRGSSAKGDDVDIVWQLRATDDGYEFVRKASRISWVPEKVAIRMNENPHLSFSRALGGWPAGTKEKATELDSADVPIDAGRAVATRMLKEKGLVAGRTLILNAALKYRRERALWP